MFDIASPHPAAQLQRARGCGRIAVTADEAGATRLARLYQDGCAKIRLPRDASAASLEAVLINTAGGLTGGDQLEWQADVGAGAYLTLSTQACERVYRALDSRAEAGVDIAIGPDARLDWIPQETILFDGGALNRRLDVELAPGAVLLAAEAVILGRTAMAETVRRGVLHDRWRIRRDGRLLFADDLCFEGPIADLSTRAPVLDGGRAMASLLLVSDDAERLVAPLRQAIGPLGGASAFDGKLFARIAAEDGRALRRALIPALEVLRGGLPCPRVWRL